MRTLKERGHRQVSKGAAGVSAGPGALTHDVCSSLCCTTVVDGGSIAEPFFRLQKTREIRLVATQLDSTRMGGARNYTLAVKKGGQHCWERGILAKNMATLLYLLAERWRKEVGMTVCGDVSF